MAKTTLFLVLIFLSSACATAGRDIPPARQAAAAPAPTSAAPRIILSVLPGWKPIEVATLDPGSDLGFRNDEARAVITAKALPARDWSVGRMLRGSVGEFAARGIVCGEPAVEGESYGVMRCADARERSRSIMAVRRPAGHPDVLLVMGGTWPRSLPPSFDDEVDLMFLLASVE